MSDDNTDPLEEELKDINSDKIEAEFHIGALRKAHEDMLEPYLRETIRLSGQLRLQMLAHGFGDAEVTDMFRIMFNRTLSLLDSNASSTTSVVTLFGFDPTAGDDD